MSDEWIPPLDELVFTSDLDDPPEPIPDDLEPPRPEDDPPLPEKYRHHLESNLEIVDEFDLQGQPTVLQPPHTVPAGGIGNASELAGWMRDMLGGSPEDQLAQASVDVLGDLYLQEARKRHADGYHPFPTGIEALDCMLGGGIQRGVTTLLVAAPGVGKTSAAIDWAMKTAEGTPRRPVLVVTLENTRYSMLSLCMSHITGRPRMDFITAEDPEALALIERWTDHIKRLPMAMVSEASPANIETLVNAMTAKYGEPPLVVLDYAQLLADPANMKDARLGAETVSEQLTAVAKRTDCALLALSSMARGKGGYGGRPYKPQLGDAQGAAKESGRWESDASAVIGLYYVGDDEASNGREKYMWGLVDKNRFNGKVGLVALKYDGMRCSFQQHEPDQMPDPRKADDNDHDRTDLDEQIDVRVQEAVRNWGLKTQTAVVDAVAGKRQTKLARIRFLIATGQLAKDSDGNFRWSR